MAKAFALNLNSFGVRLSRNKTETQRRARGGGWQAAATSPFGFRIGSRTAAAVLPFPIPTTRPTAAVIKEVLDLLGATVLLFLFLPILVLAAVAIKLTSPGPVFFVQRRIGYGAREFNMYKLRTMRVGADQEQDCLAQDQQDRTFLKIKDDPRTTPVGRFLRKYSIDELPQLYNVMKGDMSLVGPRPILVCDYAKFPKHRHFRCRFAMKPGVTGLWQVSGRSSLSDERRLELDAQYVANWNVWVDLKILARTVPVVLFAKGAM